MRSVDDIKADLAAHAERRKALWTELKAAEAAATEARRKQMAAEYQAMTSIREIAKRHHVSVYTVYTACRQFGVRHTALKEMTPEQLRRYKRLRYYHKEPRALALRQVLEP